MRKHVAVVFFETLVNGLNRECECRKIRRQVAGNTTVTSVEMDWPFRPSNSDRFATSTILRDNFHEGGEHPVIDTKDPNARIRGRIYGARECAPYARRGSSLDQFSVHRLLLGNIWRTYFTGSPVSKKFFPSNCNALFCTLPRVFHALERVERFRREIGRVRGSAIYNPLTV